MKSSLKSLMHLGDISPLSYYFAEFISKQSLQPIDSILGFSAALVSEANQAGDVCMRLSQVQGRFFNSDQASSLSQPEVPKLDDWRKSLLTCDTVGSPCDIAPLILDGDRLYLYRFWFYESQLACFLSNRLEKTEAFDTHLLTTRLDQLYPAEPGSAFNEQKLAVALACLRRFTVISGGPGTGKTSTVINLLSVLLEQQSDLRIRLAAPTGKAATRMMESVRRGSEKIQIEPSILSRIPMQASTIHRLLGTSRQGFVYNQDHRLPVDCIVIDEASMVDLTLMYQLMLALPEHTRVILLGDRNQLASVSAGNVLGDITGQGSQIRYSENQTSELEAILKQPLEFPIGSATPISDAIALLKKSYRFDAESGIGQLAELINQGDADQMISFLNKTNTAIRWSNNQTDQPLAKTIDSVLENYQQVIQSDSVDTAFDVFESCRILCAVRGGNFGVEAIDFQIVNSLWRRQLITEPDVYCGKPILITSNDYELELFNGDIGLIWYDENKKLRAYFRDLNKGLRSLAISNLPTYESAWAMTVHKSQGSEFDKVFLILPSDNPSQALTRELLYTAATRARSELVIDASESSLKVACENRSMRHSGLAQMLGW